MRRDRSEVSGPDCVYCGRRMGSEFRSSCHVCGESYCYIHMQEHSRTHARGGSEPLWQEMELLPRSEEGTKILTSDPDEIRMIRAYILNLLGPGWRPRPLERNLE